MASRAKRKSQSQPEIRLEFKTKEGYYTNLKSHRYSKPRGLPLLGKELSRTRVSVVSVKDMQGLSEWVLFNSGKEFFCYPFSATERVPDLTNPVDKHSYRASYPLSHDVNQATRSVDSLDLVIGFNGGPLQRINPITKSSIALYNNDRLIDPTDVTCVRWVPGSEIHFVSSHMSGNLYTWNTEQKYRSSNPPTFSVHKKLKDTTIYISRPKHRFPVINRWGVGHGPITAFAFSPDTAHIAVANQDGFLRIYDFHSMELYGRMRSYYGGFLCVCWSPDGKYVVTGGEDDLVSVWSYHDKAVVTRGEGHHSYVNGVSFDPYTMESDSFQLNEKRKEEEGRLAQPSSSDLRSRSSRFFDECESYRVGSIGQDGLVCLWELTSDSLTMQRRGNWSRTRTVISKQASAGECGEGGANDGRESEKHDKRKSGSQCPSSANEDQLHVPIESPDHGRKVEGKVKGKKKRHNSDTVEVELVSPTDSVPHFPDGAESSSLSSDSAKSKKKKSIVKSATKKFKNLVNSGGGGGGGGLDDDPSSPRHLHVNNFESCQSDDIAPKMIEVNVIEPLVCKKIWSERLSDIIFREDCILISTEDGFVQLWARPGRIPEEELPTPSNPGLNSPKPPGTAGGEEELPPATLQEAKHTSV